MINNLWVEFWNFIPFSLQTGYLKKYQLPPPLVPTPLHVQYTATFLYHSIISLFKKIQGKYFFFSRALSITKWRVVKKYLSTSFMYHTAFVFKLYVCFSMLFEKKTI